MAHQMITFGVGALDQQKTLFLLDKLAFYKFGQAVFAKLVATAQIYNIVFLLFTKAANAHFVVVQKS